MAMFDNVVTKKITHKDNVVKNKNKESVIIMEQAFIKKLETRLQRIYSSPDKTEEALRLIGNYLDVYEIAKETEQDLSERDSILITYGNTLTEEGRPGLEVLHDFLNEFVQEAIETVHLLPMYPYTSDDGFSVVDYREINPELGNWENIQRLSHQYGLMFDAVINHISRSSRWFEGYLNGEEPYTEYFITCDPDADYSAVTRPRALPLLTKFMTRDGEKHLWTTFSEDQIDLNFNCPALLAEILDILVMYGRRGAKFIRLDAIGFLWKEPGTTCMHLPRTHEVVKLMKDVLREYAPGTRIITETNVPHKDNISYFGENGNEADLVYQFPLPPLTMHTFLSENAEVLSEWMETLQLPSEKVTYFNFLSSHDGIGVRPTEGILTKEQQQTLIDATLKNGGAVSYKNNGDGTRSPYELNINYQDALAGPESSDAERIGKFLAAETLLLSLQGVPGIYIHSLLGSRNDYYGKEISGIPRRINRENLDYGRLKEQLAEDTNRKRIFDTLIQRLNIRRNESAFSPAAGQKVRKENKKIINIIRSNDRTGETIHVLINVSGQEQTAAYEALKGKNILTGSMVNGAITLKPWECAWVKESGK